MAETLPLITTMLKEAKDTDGHSLFDHLSKFLQKIEPSSRDSFQLLSDFFKKHRFASKSVKSAEEISRLEQLINQKNEWQVEATTLLDSLRGSKKHSYSYKPLLETSRMFNQVGISFGNKEVYLLDSSIKKLAETVDAKDLRFWGKVLTRKQDYYIVKGISSKANKTDVKDNVEKGGVGVNQFTYWVTHNYLNQWLQLPLVTPQQIQSSRMINYIFTGDLNADVDQYPPFPGKQRHLLKAQIVRITHGCEISPQGLFGQSTVEGAEDEIQYAEDFAYPEFAELGSLEKWVHTNRYILKEGRTTHYVDKKLSEEQRDAANAEFDETGEKKARLLAISQDKLVEGEKEQPYWFSRTYGDQQLFKAPLDDQGGSESSYAVVAIKSLLWSGWTTVSTKDDFASVYIGYGLKEGQQLLTPISPQNLGEEGEDQDEYPEPNPKEPLDELEPDSDDENKKEEEEEN